MQEPRQLYGLGSLVKSIGKTVKKVIKSPIGKGLLLAGGLGLAGIGPFSGLARTGVGQTLFGGATKFLPGATAAMKGAATTSPGLFGTVKNFLGTTGGKFTAGALTSILAATGMGADEIEATKRDPEKIKMYLRDYISKTNPDFSDDQVEEEVNLNISEYAIGGRVGLESGNPKKGLESLSIEDLPVIKGPHKIRYDKDGNPIRPEFPRKGEPHKYNPDKKFDRKNMPFILPLKRNKVAFGGLQSMPMGQMRRNKAGTIERDYRETGGFVPVGIKEKADDVPAMLSKNEFVMTADAVRGIGDGNIEKGAQRLYDQMKQAEKRVV